MIKQPTALTFLDIPDVALHLFGTGTDTACGTQAMSGTMRVFEQTPLEKRCGVCQAWYLQMPVEEIELQRDRFLTK